MNVYKFLSKKESCVKTTYPILNIISFVRVFNFIEARNDKIEEIRMNQIKFNELQKKMKKNIFDNNAYKSIVQQKKIFNTPIIIDNEIQKQIIYFKSQSKINDVKLFIGII